MTFCKLISKQYAILNQSIIWFGRKVLPVWTDDSDFRKIKLETGKKAPPFDLILNSVSAASHRNLNLNKWASGKSQK